MKYQEYINYLIKWIQEKVNNAGAKGVIIGLSGGIDSSVVASLAKQAFPNDSLGVITPIDSMDNDLQDIKELINEIKLKFITINLNNTFKMLSKEIAIKDKMAIINIKPRLRMISLYALAKEKNYLVLGTDNKIEWELGYFTKYGDGGVDLLPLSRLLKYEVKEIGKILHVPINIINKIPSAGLWDGQTDEEELGFTYNDADKYFSGDNIDSSIKVKIERLMKNAFHKKHPIPKPLSMSNIKFKIVF